MDVATDDYAAQLNPNLPAARRLARAEVIAKFTIPFTSFSQELGVSTTVLKRVCAKHGIHKWPYRQVGAVLWPAAPPRAPDTRPRTPALSCARSTSAWSTCART